MSNAKFNDLFIFILIKCVLFFILKKYRKSLNKMIHTYFELIFKRPHYIKIII